MTFDLILNTLAGPFLLSFICPIPLSFFLFLIYDFKHSSELRNPGSQWTFLKSILSRYVSGFIIGVGLRLFITGNTEADITKIAIGAFLGPSIPLEGILQVVNNVFTQKLKGVSMTDKKSEKKSDEGNG
jgi:hypothetical protein